MKTTDKLSGTNAIAALRRSADVFMKVDGDRDYMNQSDLRCEQTQIAARLMREVADWIETQTR